MVLLQGPYLTLMTPSLQKNNGVIAGHLFETYNAIAIMCNGVIGGTLLYIYEAAFRNIVVLLLQGPYYPLTTPSL